jgi:hypothetical protein
MRYRPKLRSLNSTLATGLHQSGGDNELSSNRASDVLPLGNATGIEDEVRDLSTARAAVPALTRFVVFSATHGACRLEMRVEHESQQLRRLEFRLRIAPVKLPIREEGAPSSLVLLLELTYALNALVIEGQYHLANGVSQPHSELWLQELPRTFLRDAELDGLAHGYGSIPIS